jgi:glycosyltransferase involved in cell wall biosynthesis
MNDTLKDTSNTMKVYAIIPGYNEEKTIRKVAKQVLEYCDNVIVVDDGSKDNTQGELKGLPVHALRHVLNLGKGAALKTGCDFALEQGATHLVVLDADGQHDPLFIPEFIKKLKDYEIIFSYRTFTGSMPLILRFGNWALTKAAAVLYGVLLKDTQSGYRGFTREAYQKVRWASPDYSMETEMIANTGKANLKYDELPISTIYSDKYKGTTVLDGFKIVLNMLKWKIR